MKKNNKEKRFEIDVTIRFTQVEYAKNKKLAIQQVKYTFADEYNLDLTNKEIEAVRE